VKQHFVCSCGERVVLTVTRSFELVVICLIGANVALLFALGLGDSMKAHDERLLARVEQSILDGVRHEAGQAR
jgi:hypothetical protein